MKQGSLSQRIAYFFNIHIYCQYGRLNFFTVSQILQKSSHIHQPKYVLPNTQVRVGKKKCV